VKLERVSIKEESFCKYFQKTVGDINISFTKFSQRCFENHSSKVYKIVVFKIVGLKHYVPVVL
jgi:hypothetical protein